MADPECFDVVPDPYLDPTFQADADPDPTFFLARERKKCSSKSSFFLLHNLTKLVMCNFCSNNAGGGARVEG